MRSFITSRKLFAPLSVLAIIALWWLAALAVNRSILLPTPPETVQELIRIAQTGAFWSALLGTLARSLAGFAAAFVAALVLAVLAGLIGVVHELLRPVVAVLRSLPTIAITLLALIWLDVNVAPVLIGFLVIFPIMYEGIRAAILNVDPLLTEMAQVYRVGRWRRIRRVYIPITAPYIFSSVTAAIGLNIKIMVAAEVISQPPRAIGTRLMLAKINLNTAELFAWTLVTIALSFALEGILRAVQARVLRRSGRAG